MALILQAQFPNLFLANALPALDAIIFGKYDSLPKQFSQIYRMLTSKREIEQTTQMAGLSLFTEVKDGQPVNYDAPAKGYDKTYTHAQFGLGFRASRVFADDDRFGIIKKMAVDLGKSANETVELLAAATFNNGFSASYLGPDGKALFATDHPLQKTMGSQSNKQTYADLDVTSLQLALTAFRKQVDPSGRKIRVKPSQLIVPPELEWAAIEILGGTMRSDTANNTVNAFKRREGLGPFDSYNVWDYLTDPQKWFISAAPTDTELRFYWREQPNTIHDIDFDTRSLKTAMWMRFSFGWSDYQGVVGVG